ncbi:hypothetical protein MAR_024480 [Mya arenaria]|uniref:DUF4371 domain-containing protein n=1 Tax=Mya arenaria TaxID=6604 RepID=A0ABY7DQY2_MYAAR|nr:hypothetical protein MAR_024479 [Mya arenaria]WAR00108.1 hypothetical protein MAR_024480 [Mya arenaria]
MMKHPQNNREVFPATTSVRFKQDTVETYSSRNIHSTKTSCFHQELLKKSEAENTYVQKAFFVAYFLMKEFTLLIKSFNHFWTSFRLSKLRGSHQENFQTIGDTIKTELMENVNKSLAYGLLTDEESGISVNKNIVTSIQFYCAETKKVETNANANAIKTLLANEVEKFEPKLTGFSSDGASVMTGKVGGVAALLRCDHPSMINIHCVCHRLALSCNDSNEALTYIKTIETLLRQLCQLFENSPKKWRPT